MDGINIENNSNAVDDVLEGVTFNLMGYQASSANDVSLTIATDIEAIKSTVEEFLTAYNNALEYVQKVGSQPTFFSDPVEGIFPITDAKVTLHCVQPSFFLGARVPDLGFVPRIYVGTSIVLKVSEEWSDFPGQANIEWGYRNTDIVGHVGVSLGVGPVTVDFRYTQGFIGQLVHDNTQPLAAKAETPPEGVHVPEEGAKLTTIQLGAGFTF